MLRETNLPFPATLEEAVVESEAVARAEGVSQALDFDRLVLGAEYQAAKDYFAEGVGRVVAIAAEDAMVTRLNRFGPFRAESWRPGVMQDSCHRLTIEFSRSDKLPPYDGLAQRAYPAPKAWPRKRGGRC